MILVVANTIIGKKGNIGYRIGKVMDGFDSNEYVIVARGLCDGYNGISLGPLGLICRILNGIRRYVFPMFNSRKYDIFLFNIGVILAFNLMSSRNQVDKVYLVESSAFLISYFNKKGIKVILDVPIAPTRHIKKITCDLNLRISSFRYNDFLDEQESRCYELADSIIVPSEYIYEFITQMSSNIKVQVIPFGVDGSSQPKEKFPCSKKVTYGFLGNISSRKGIDFLLEAWSLFDESSSCKLILQGKIHSGIDRYLPKRGVEVRGFGSIKDFFDDIDCLVLPSLMEGSAKVIYEAISHHCPVYVSEYAGAPYIDGVGIKLIPSLSVEGILSVFHEFTLNESCRSQISDDYVRKFLEKYSWEEYARRVRKVIRSV